MEKFILLNQKQTEIGMKYMNGKISKVSVDLTYPGSSVWVLRKLVFHSEDVQISLVALFVVECRIATGPASSLCLFI